MPQHHPSSSLPQHFDVRHPGIQVFFIQVQTEKKNTCFGRVTDPGFKWKCPEQGGGWRGGEHNFDSCCCGMLGSSGDLSCCWPGGASPGPGEMQALLCFKSVLKKGQPLRILTKSINECSGQGWVHPWTPTWLVGAAQLDLCLLN